MLTGTRQKNKKCVRHTEEGGNRREKEPEERRERGGKNRVVPRGIHRDGTKEKETPWEE